MSGYTERLKQALTGDARAEFVWLCNFEVETQWAHGHAGLPTARSAASSATVARMTELGALLAEPTDYLLLDRPLDESYRGYLDKIGLGAPTELRTDRLAGAEGLSGRVLGSPVLLERLRGLAARGGYLMPMGNSVLEQRITEYTGLRQAAPSASVCATVNSKIYSRLLTERLGLREIPGYCVRTVDELATALDNGLDTGAIIVKDAYGVSGKGLLVLTERRKAEQLLRMVRRRAAKTGSDALDLVVERFLPKRCDLNYQFTVGRDGTVAFDFVKQAITEGGVHRGHLMPAALTTAQHDELRHAAEAIGAALYRDGFFGVAGVDALLGADERIYPVVEINARLNMASYQGSVTERFQRPGAVAMAKHYPLTLTGPVSFDDVLDAVGTPEDTESAGVVITCFGTVNAEHEAGAGAPFEGRLHTLLFAGSHAELTELDRRTAVSLGKSLGKSLGESS